MHTVPKHILIAPELAFTVGVVTANTGVSADGEGKKIIKAGSPLKGTLDGDRTDFSLCQTAETPVGIALHDIDVTKGNANGTLVVSGYVDTEKLDESVKSLLDATIKGKLTRIVFIKGGN